MNIEFAQRALEDMRAQTDFIAGDKPGAALMVASRIESSIRNLAEFPNLGRAGSGAGTHELQVPKTPFIVVYRIAKRKVVILRIRHAAQNWR